MLVIRLFRIGKRNQPSFKIVVTDKRKASKGGRFVEEVGFWSPLTKKRTLKTDRIKHWISVGAKPSDTIFNFLVQEKIVEAKKIPVHKKSKKEPQKQAPASVSVSVPVPVLVEGQEARPQAAPEAPKPEEAKEEKPKAEEPKEESEQPEA